MNFTRVLSLDIETRSDKDLPNCGVYNYVNTPTFKLLWLTYAYDYGELVTIDLWHSPLPQHIIDDLQDPTVLKVAANATFERICFSRVLGVYLPPEQWTCTLILAGRNGLPMNLEGAALRSGAAAQKDKEGKTLMDLFSMPQKPTKKNAGKMWFDPEQDMQKWYGYGSYNRQDVATETAVRVITKNIPVSQFEDRLYHLDQRINDRGVLIDRLFVQQAIRLNTMFTDRIKQQVIEITGIRNPNSRNQMLEWINQETDGNYTKFDKEAVKAILGNAPEPIVQQVLEARQQISLASLAKYKKMESYAGADSRARGTLQMYGAMRTGRWAGRGIQLHNLTKHTVSPAKLDEFRALIRAGDMNGLAAANDGNLPDALSQCVRTSFIAKPGHQFMVSDYSAIEARVLAWIAGEQWRLDFFHTDGDIYIESAARMFKVDPRSIDKKNPLRQNGKVAELACVSGEALVCTKQDGWIKLKELKYRHTVWDGLDYVKHDGLINRGYRRVIRINGVDLTPDHEVLTVYDKWVEAQHCEYLISDRGDTIRAFSKIDKNHSQKVYDIANCGDLNRFVVRERGYSPFIVHNCGYGGGKGAMYKMDKKKSIPENDYANIVRAWRNENPAIVQFWADVEDAALRAIVSPDRFVVAGKTGKVSFYYKQSTGNLHCILPSGRWLTYVRARIVMGKFGNPAIQYEGVGDQGKWSLLDTYGGKFVENIVQAISRDILATGMFHLDRNLFDIVLHVHDETVSEEPINGRSLEEVNHLMCIKAPWYADLPLEADGFISPYYKKDDK